VHKGAKYVSLSAFTAFGMYGDEERFFIRDFEGMLDE
jgi:hypothetical protein